MNLEQKLDLLLKLMNDIQAENAMLACFVQASIASHHSPRALLDVFNMASNQVIGALLANPEAPEETIARMEKSRNQLVGQIEHALQMQRALR